MVLDGRNPRDERRMKLPTAGCCQFGPRMVPVHISGGEGRVAAIPVSVKTILKPSLQSLLNGCFLSNQGFLGHFGTQSMPSLFRDEMGWTPTVAAICSCCRKCASWGGSPARQAAVVRRGVCGVEDMVTAVGRDEFWNSSFG